jgi:hypothetical protein
MAKRKQSSKKVLYNGILFDSQNEVEFWCWCKELEKHKIISHLSFHPPSFKLIDKQSITKPFYSSNRTLQGHIYTTDFKFKIANRKKWNIMNDNLKCVYVIIKGKTVKKNLEIIDKGDWVYIDTKGKHNRNERMFTVDIKLVLEQYELFINKVIPEYLFRSTGVPNYPEVILSPVLGKRRKRYEGMNLMDVNKLTSIVEANINHNKNMKGIF